MQTKGIKTGDVKTWAIEVLNKGLVSVINSKQHLRRPYYIVIVMKEGYMGPPAMGNNNELLHGVETKETPHDGEAKTVDLSGKRTMHHRFIITLTKSPVPQIGSALVYINNSTGQVRFEYILPPDTPAIPGFDVEMTSEFAAECGIGMPYVYGAN